jgi:hypothetical protein
MMRSREWKTGDVVDAARMNDMVRDVRDLAAAINK